MGRHFINDLDLSPHFKYFDPFFFFFSRYIAVVAITGVRLLVSQPEKNIFKKSEAFLSIQLIK